MRIASVPKWTFAEVVISGGVWGANRSRFGKWAKGETLVLLIGREGVVTATVTGKSFTSDQVMWKDDLYEYRIPVHVDNILRGDPGAAATQASRKSAVNRLVGSCGAYIMSQSKLPEEVERLVKAAL